MSSRRALLVVVAASLAACTPNTAAAPDGRSPAPEASARDVADAAPGPDDATSERDDSALDAQGDASVTRDAAPSHDAAAATYRNFVLAQNGDPFCARFGDRYYVYVPDQVAGGGRVLGFTSSDLVHWASLGAVFDNVDEMRGGQQSTGLWAPEVLGYMGHYYLYYASLMSNPLDASVGDKDIEVVESDDPTDFYGGPRTVLLDDAYAFIDPDPFLDPVTGRLYLVFKRRGAAGTGSEIDVRPMGSPTSFTGPATLLVDSDDVPDSDHTTEQPTMWRAGDLFYLLFSTNDGGGTRYRIAYATASDPMGAFTLRGTLFQSSADLTGDLSRAVISPGSSSIVHDGAMNTWRVYRQKTTTADTFADREVAIDRVTFDPPTHAIIGTASHGVDRPAPVAP